MNELFHGTCEVLFHHHHQNHISLTDTVRRSKVLLHAIFEKVLEVAVKVVIVLSLNVSVAP
jgi:hypothetical protein